ncbi:MAG: ABC transporter ATP-binding protein, partial [Ignavibacteria bacterium]|nr:ABC transporter ATP-binding protein [Ignavibacteria bacterium]
MKIYEVRNLKFSYNNQSSKNLVIDDINFDVSYGEFISILGPNGSGKTTLLKLLARLLKLDSGELLIDGKYIDQIEGKEFYKIVAYVPQRFISIFPYTV